MTNGGWDDYLEIRRASDIQQKPIDWIWTNRLARGKLTLIGGDPDLGKSQTVLDILARITCEGATWPDGEPIDRHGNCLVLSAEDAANDTTVPRLDFAGANLTRVGIVDAVAQQQGQKKRSFNLQDDLEKLGRQIKRIGGAIAVGIDPITAYMGDTDSHRTADVRSVLEPVARFAEDYNIGIIGVTHPPKAIQAKAIHSFTGSLAFVAAARLAFIAIKEPATERRLLLPVKNNLGPKALGLGYKIVGGVSSKGVVTSRVDWDRLPVTVTANDAIYAEAEANRKGSAISDAKAFLSDYLADGPQPVKEMQEAAKANGITERTLNRARTQLGVIAVKANDLLGSWMARLP